MNEQGLRADGRQQGLKVRPLLLATPAEARRELERIGVDPTGISLMLPKLEHHAVLLHSVRSAAANILKQEMLSLGGDAAVARGTVSCSVPVTDTLLIGTLRQLLTLCKKLAGQPFGLSSLATEVSLLLENIRQLPTFWQTSRRRLTLKRPLIMGILNVTPDSFSDGGCYFDPSRAVEHALQMEKEGADLIDVGGESSRPGAENLPADEELKRVLPVIEALASRLSIPVSVDTWKSSVADACLSAGAEIINDISGLNFDPLLADIVASKRAGLVLMHTRGNPEQMQENTFYKDLMGEVATGLKLSAEKALKAGISREMIVLDPGIGFAKDKAGNLEIMRRLPELLGLGYPLMIGTSRKSFIGKVLELESTADRLFGTAATVGYAVSAGARILRVHDVKAMKDVALMTDAIISQPP